MEYFDKILWDIHVYHAADGETTEQRQRRALAEAEERLEATPDDLNSRHARARAHFHLGNDEQAEEDLAFVTEQAPDFSGAYQYRAIIHARSGRAQEARQDLERFNARSTSAAW